MLSNNWKNLKSLSFQFFFNLTHFDSSLAFALRRLILFSTNIFSYYWLLLLYYLLFIILTKAHVSHGQSDQNCNYKIHELEHETKVCHFEDELIFFSLKIKKNLKIQNLATIPICEEKLTSTVYSIKLSTVKITNKRFGMEMSWFPFRDQDVNPNNIINYYINYQRWGWQIKILQYRS